MIAVPLEILIVDEVGVLTADLLVDFSERQRSCETDQCRALVRLCLHLLGSREYSRGS